MKAWLKSVQERMRRKYKQRAWPALYRSFSRKESRKMGWKLRGGCGGLKEGLWFFSVVILQQEHN